MTIIRTLFVTLALTITAVAQTTEPPKQDAVVPGTRIRLAPPAGFTPATQFPGFSREDLGSSIIVAELPAPISELSSAFRNAKELEKRGMELLNQHEVKINNQTGWLFHIKQTASGIEYRKWILLFGDEKDAVLVTASFPKEMEADLSESMKSSLLTVKWDKGRIVEPTEGVSFAVAEKGELKLAHKIVNSLSYTKHGIFPSKALDDPVFIVAQSISKVDVADKEQFARTRVFQTASMTNLEIQRSSQITIDKLTGYEILAKGNDNPSGTPMILYQVVLFEESGYFLIQGMVSRKNSESYVPVFEEMARTFRRK